ncbi:MAG: helix-turn-helix domain-containing protein [Candidatus Micrarchaeaceae archaeon]
MKTAYKYRAYPPRMQKAKLDRQMLLAKNLYNLILEKSKAYYKEIGKALAEYRTNIWLMQIKKGEQEFAQLYLQVLQNVSKMMSDAYKHIFMRCKEKKHGKNVKAGFPRFKKYIASLAYLQSGFKIEKKRALLSNIGNWKVKSSLTKQSLCKRQLPAKQELYSGIMATNQATMEATNLFIRECHAKVYI